jgi:hypothetical protein
MSSGQYGSQVRFRENVRFGPFSWVIADDFQDSGQFFLQHPGCAQTPSMRHLSRFSFIFGPWGTCFVAFFGSFRCLWSRELRAQTEARMMHFITRTVPPPRTDHSLMHNSTSGMSPGQKGSQVRFRENVRFTPFSWVIAHDFQDSGQFFCNTRMCIDSFYKTFGDVFIFGP